MKNFLIIITLISFTLTNGQVHFRGSTIDTNLDVREPSEEITKVETVKDTLYVYKTLYTVNSGMLCAVYHPDSQCNLTEPHNVRDVYTMKEGEMALIKRQWPEIKEVKKIIIQYKEIWE
jgi:hypothetical protein